MYGILSICSEYVDEPFFRSSFEHRVASPSMSSSSEPRRESRRAYERNVQLMHSFDARQILADSGAYNNPACLHGFALGKVCAATG